ncbi:MAG: pilus assembly protein TadG-related protein [Candidatus Limnocylindria bacterium]
MAGWMRRRADHHESGQIIAIVAVAFIVLLMFLAVLFDGGSALVRRRQLQDAGDAAALAAANVIHVGTPRGCSGTVDGAVPRASVDLAARDSLAANLSWFDPLDAVITCATGYGDWAVSVEIDTQAPRFFSGLMGGPLQVHSRSVAVNGQISGTNYAILELDPHNPSWPNGRRGCPSLLLSGGPTVTLEGSVQINSACPASSGGGLATNGNASKLTLLGSAKLRVVGGYSPAALTITPAPVTGVAPTKDPLAGLPPIDIASLPVRSSSKLTLNNQLLVLQPGVYQGGIQLKNSSTALLQPGIYVMRGGGFDVGAQASVYSVRTGVLITTPLTWGVDCPTGSCGVLIFNAKGATTAMGPVTIGAGATLKLRAYNPTAQAGGVSDYDNLLLWQDALPLPSASYEQPEVALSGGGSVDISGTVYAPSARVAMGGGAGGSGGSTNLTLQFISWDLEFRGNSSFTFYFRDEDFARPTSYGLVE